MAIKGIDTISSEFEAVVDAFPSIEAYGKGAVEIINDNSSYPFLLFNTDQTTAATSSITNVGLPKRRAFNCRILLFDEWSETEKATVDLTEKYQQLEEVVAQFLGKIYKRSLSNVSNITIPQNYDLDFAQNVHNDALVSVGCDITVHILSSNCDEGTFTDLLSPSLTSITAIGSSLSLVWVDNSNNESGFRVFRSENYSGPYIQIGSDLAAGTTEYTDTTALTDTLYYYKIAAFTDTITAYSNVLGGYVSSGNSSFVYNVLIDGVDSGEDVTIDGSNITINLI